MAKQLRSRYFTLIRKRCINYLHLNPKMMARLDFGG